MFKQTITITSKTDDIRISRKIQQQLQQWQTTLLTALQKQPGSPNYPIRWTPAANQNRPPNTRWGYYSRQKAAFFATDGFGRGIPTRRTGAVSQAWSITVNYEQINRVQAFAANLLQFLARLRVVQPPEPPPAAVLIDVHNPVSYERYVTGYDQQGFHQDTGWIYAPTVIETGFKEAEGIVSGDWL